MGSSLPHRQLRKRGRAADAPLNMFTAAQAAQEIDRATAKRWA